MPSIIGRVQVWHSIANKLRLSQPAPSTPLMEDALKLVLDVRSELLRAGSRGVTLDLSGAAGAIVTHADLTVPAGKRWRLKRVYREATLTATFVTYQQAGHSNYQISVSQTAADVIAPDLLLDAGDRVGLVSTGNAGDTAIDIATFYDEEDFATSGRA